MQQLLIHLLGDYLFQTGYMANNKAKSHLPALIHVLVYTSFFLILTRNPITLFVICSTHFIIDRFRIPKYLIWIREGCKYPLTDTGFSKETPPFISTWLFIITDNAMHLSINFLALRYIT